MQTIDTGYKPEFGLGAYFAGQNSANVEDFNQEELIKNFIANQQSKQNLDQSNQMNPLLIAEQRNKNTVGDFDAAYADAKRTSPSFIQQHIKGMEAQDQSQINAAEKNKALAPFQIAAEKAAAEVDKRNADTQWTIQDLDRQLSDGGGTDASGNIVKFTPMQRMFMQNKREELNKQLMETPKFAGQSQLQDDKIEGQLEAMRLRMQNQMDAAELKSANASAKALSDKQLYAKAYQIVSGMVPASDQEKLAAKAILDGMQADAIGKNAALTNPTMDLGAMSDGKVKMTTPQAQVAREKAEASRAAANTAPAGMSIDKLRTMYPGKSDDFLRAAYKQKFGEDIK